MNKIEFSKLEKKEDMQLAFNQLKDDYHTLFERHERLKEIIEEIREYINNENYKDENICVVNGIEILQILDKAKGE